MTFFFMFAFMFISYIIVFFLYTCYFIDFSYIINSSYLSCIPLNVRIECKLINFFMYKKSIDDVVQHLQHLDIKRPSLLNM